MGRNLKLKRNIRTLLLLTILTGVTALIVFHSYIFGRKLLAFTDIGSDTANLYLSQYISIVRKMRTGRLALWDSTNGFGINLFQLNLTSPFLDVVYLVGYLKGTAAIPHALLWTYIAEIWLAGVFFYLYLNVFDLSEYGKLLASYLFSFNGFMMVWGQHYAFASVCVFLPLELLMVERCIRTRRKWAGLAVMTAVLCANSMYTSYMSLIFTGFYVLWRFLQRKLKSLGTYISDVWSVLRVMLLGVCLGCFSLIPQYLAISDVSSRLGKESPLITRLFGSGWSPSYYLTLLGRMLSTTMFGITDYDGYLNYYEGPCLFFSSLFILIFIQYLFIIPKMKCNLKNKILQYILAGIFTLCALTTTTGVVMNGFVETMCRWMFLYFIYFGLVTAVTVTELVWNHVYSRIGLAAGLAALTAGYLYCAERTAYDDASVWHVLLVTGLIMGALILLIGDVRTSWVRRIFIIALELVLVVNVATDISSDFDSRKALTANDETLSGTELEDTKRAVRWISDNDSEYYRIEKTYEIVRSTDSMRIGYRSVSAYNSTMNANILAFANTYWPDLYLDDDNHLVYATSLKLVLNDEGQYQVVTGRDGNEGQLCGVKYVLTDNPDMNLMGYSVYKTFGSIIVLKSDSVENIGSMYSSDPAVTPLAKGKDGVGTIDVNYDSRLTDVSVTLSGTGSDDLVKGSVRSDGGYLVAAIPYEKGWSVWVDGKKSKMLRADEGFIAVELSAGTHAVEFRYECPGVRVGFVISIAAVLIMIPALVISVKREQTRRRIEKIRHSVEAEDNL
ncbi:MAG: YfhO family protein [Chordicoccus sp.]